MENQICAFTHRMKHKGQLLQGYYRLLVNHTRVHVVVPPPSLCQRQLECHAVKWVAHAVPGLVALEWAKDLGAPCLQRFHLLEAQHLLVQSRGQQVQDVVCLQEHLPLEAKADRGVM